MPINKINIQIVSDPICPWCYIGLRRLNTAIQQLNINVKVQKKFIAYQLHPWMPSEGLDQNKLLEMKYGKQRSKQMSSNLKSAAESEGIKMNFRKIDKVPNTLIAHLLIKEAQKLDMAEELYWKLFKSYFELGEDIGKISVLKKITHNIELNINIDKLIDNETKKEEIKSEENTFRNKGIAAVPAYIINNKKLIEGAQSSTLFLNSLNEELVS